MICIARWARHGQTASRTIATPTVSEADAGEAPAACGWFDSSHELSAGLLVCEHTAAGADAAWAALPLATWLEVQLSGWSGGAAA